MESSYLDKLQMIFTAEQGWTEFNHKRKSVNCYGDLEDSRGNVITADSRLNGYEILRVGSSSLKTIHIVDYPEKYFLPTKDGGNIVRKRNVSFDLVALESHFQIDATIKALGGRNTKYLNMDGFPCDDDSPLLARVSTDIVGANCDTEYTVNYVVLPKRKVRPAKFFRYGIFKDTVLTF